MSNPHVDYSECNRPPETHRKHSSGFTLVELLVVIAIIGILVAMLLPAVQAAREAARRSQCLNAVKQVALACLNYHDTYGEFPAAATYDVRYSGAVVGMNRRHSKNWLIDILPFVEEQPLYDTFDLTAFLNADVYPGGTTPEQQERNRTARGAVVAAYVCPSDSGHETLYNTSTDGDNWARGNFAANGGLGAFQGVVPTSDTSVDPLSARAGSGSNAPRWRWPLTGGVMGGNTARRIAQITDGTTNTVMVAEVRVGLTEFDPRGTWALPLAGASAVWMHGSDNAPGPNSCIAGGDSIKGGDRVLAELGEDYLLQECMPCDSAGGIQAAPRSRHPGGVHVAMCDGSGHFVVNEVETGTEWDIQTEEDLLVWQRMNAANDGLIVEDF